MDGVSYMNRIKQLREEKRMTQVRLSIELGVSQETVSAYEKGKYYPAFLSLVKLSEIFGVSIDYIMGLSDVRCAISGLCEKESLVIENFRKLNDTDREKALAYISGLIDAKADKL